MNDIPLGYLFLALIGLLFASAFFSSSETAMMSLNRYRLKHLVKANHRGARRANALLQQPDRLIGLILLGNNFVNIVASAIATLIALRLFGEAGIAIATMALTVAILIFAEVTPKTLAALHPERVAFPAAYVLTALLKISYPFVYAVNAVSNAILKLLNVAPDQQAMHQLSRDELRTVVNEASALIPSSHRSMLLGILDLEKVTVEDIMVPRNEIVGIDLDDDWDTIRQLLESSQHTRLPVFRGDINNVLGIVHVRSILHRFTTGDINKDSIMEVARSPYFVPEGTPLSSQLMNFQREKRRVALVVDEYGEIVGLVTLDDILEEIVGKFTSDASQANKDVIAQPDGTYLVAGSANVRELNRTMNWNLPTDGPKTLNGLILEHLESIPAAGTGVRIGDYPIEIVQTTGNAVKTVKIGPKLPPRTPPADSAETPSSPSSHPH